MVNNKEDKTEYGWGNHQRKKNRAIQRPQNNKVVSFLKL